MLGKMAPLRSALPQAAERRRLADALDVSPLCLGMVDDARTVPEAFDAGINFFFVSADMHWRYYEGTRRGLEDLLARGGGVRERVVVAAVSYVTQPEFCQLPFDEVVENVRGLERLDVTLAGAARAHDFPARAEQYARHGRLGVRAFGATFHDRLFAAEAIASRAVQIGFVRYNPEHRGAEEDLFPRIAERGPTLVYDFNTNRRLPEAVYQRLDFPASYWRPGPTDYYRFALARPEVDGILCAPRTPMQVRALVDALGRGPLTEDEHAYMCDVADLATGQAVLEDDKNPEGRR
jgi:aryl-alcohol dehydrogenase-like predicted oxidoreductase